MAEEMLQIRLVCDIDGFGLASRPINVKPGTDIADIIAAVKGTGLKISDSEDTSSDVIQSGKVEGNKEYRIIPSNETRDYFFSSDTSNKSIEAAIDRQRYTREA